MNPPSETAPIPKTPHGWNGIGRDPREGERREIEHGDRGSDRAPEGGHEEDAVEEHVQTRAHHDRGRGPVDRPVVLRRQQPAPRARPRSRRAG